MRDLGSTAVLGPHGSLVTPGNHNAEMSASGALIAESLSKDEPLDGVDLQVHKVIRRDVGDVAAGQPLTWTFIEFEVDDPVADALAEALSRSIDPSGAWYCDFRTDKETFVVFGGRVFRYHVARPRVGTRRSPTVGPLAYRRFSWIGRSNNPSAGELP
jgi:hypothetical protein